jgi:hypothetical protein
MLPRRVLFALFAVTVLGAAGCAPKIGDKCSRSSDCSVNGDRFCDTAQPHGYCTVIGCDPDTCPDGALCVEWRFEPSRTSATWCMKSCGTNKSCRGGSYACVHEGDPELYDEDGVPLARVIDLEVDRDEDGFVERGFCAAANAD